VDAAPARDIVADYLSRAPGGGWLPRGDVSALLRRYGIPLVPAAQSVATGGTEVVIGVKDDQMFGPLVVFGLGGVTAGVLADQAARLVPLTGADADTLINSIRSAPILHGHGGAPGADLAALRDVLLRVSRLADDLPDITELELNPVITSPDAVVVVDARVRIAPQLAQDPFLRRLR